MPRGFTAASPSTAYLREELFNGRKFQKLVQEGNDAHGEGIEDGVARREKMRPDEVDLDARSRKTERHGGVDRCGVQKGARKRDADDARPIIGPLFFEVPGEKKARRRSKNKARQVKQKRQEGFPAAPRGKDEVVVLQGGDGGFPDGRKDEDRTHGKARAGTENEGSRDDENMHRRERNGRHDDEAQVRKREERFCGHEKHQHFSGFARGKRDAVESFKTRHRGLSYGCYGSS